MKEALINRRWKLFLPDHRADRGVMRDHWGDRPMWDCWEQVRLAHMHLYLKPDMVLFDIGAEEGDFACLFACWGCRVVLVEPNPAAWPCIRASFEANGLTPEGTYVGFFSDTTKENPFWQPLDEWPERFEGWWPDCAYGEIVPDHGFKSLRESPEINQTTLDDYASRTGLIPNAITIDVEGSELHVLRGAEETLRTHRPLAWVSVHAAPDADFLSQYGHTREDVLNYMDSLGYRAVHLATDHEEHWFFEAIQ